MNFYRRYPLSPKMIWIFPIVGVLLLLGAAWAEKCRRDFLDYSIESQGQVTSLMAGDEVFFPVFEFKTADGRLFTRRSRFGSTRPPHDVGEVVEILYPADAPGDAEIKDVAEGHFGTYVLLALGSGFLILGLTVIRFTGTAERRVSAQRTRYRYRSPSPSPSFPPEK
jgi:hypothetical protein